jgi:hypothetical protein
MANGMVMALASKKSALFSQYRRAAETPVFSVTPRERADDPDQWLCSVGRHWNLDRRLGFRLGQYRVGHPLPCRCCSGTG